MTLQNSNYIQFIIIYDKEKQQIVTFETLKPKTVFFWFFLLMMKSLK